MDGFLGTYRLTLARLDLLAESSEPFPRPERTPERLVSALWFDRKLQSGLSTVDGRRLEVLSPGRWNAGPGPDFVEARLRFGSGKIVSGDIEVEVFASDWERHRHRRNPDFGNVILKVCLWNDILHEKAEGVPLVELFPWLADPHSLDPAAGIGYPWLSPTMRGRCAPLLDARRMDQALLFLAAAGDERIQKKAERFGILSRTFGIDQTLYKGLMEAMGYANNKEPMSRLADALNLDFLRGILATTSRQERQPVILALFFGAGGWFEKYADQSLPAELERLKEYWEQLIRSHEITPVRGFRLARLRPANSPWRRMVAMSHLLANVDGLKLFDTFLSALGNVEQRTPETVAGAAERLRAIFSELSDPFWDTRLAIGSPGGTVHALVGESLANVIIVNIVAPLILAHARQQKLRGLELFLHEFICRFNGLPHNALTRFSCARLFGPEQRQPRLATNARLHQGLIQVYHDFCHYLESGCPDCKLVDFLSDD